MHILLTRPYFQSLATQKELEASGNTVSFSPVLNIQQCEFDETIFGRSAGFIVTSANAAVQLCMRDEVDLSLPIFAVGPATAAPLINAGFVNVHIAEGDAESLIPVILKRQSPSQGMLTYLSGQNVTEDIADTLQSHGYQAKRVIVYKASPIQRLPEATQNLFLQREVDIVVFMSYRTALHFTKLIEDAGWSNHLEHIKAVCMSEQVVKGLNTKHWQDIYVSQAPSLPSIYSEIYRLTGHLQTSAQKQEQSYEKQPLNEFNLGALISRLLKENSRAAQDVMDKIRPLLDTYEAEVPPDIFESNTDKSPQKEELFNNAIVLLLYNAMKVKFRGFSVNLIKRHANTTQPYWHSYPNLNPCSPANEKDMENLGKEWISLYETETNSSFKDEFEGSNLYQMLDPQVARTLFSTAYQKFYDDTLKYYSRIDRHP